MSSSAPSKTGSFSIPPINYDDDQPERRVSLNVVLRLFQISLIAGVIIAAIGTVALLSLHLSHAGALTSFFQKVSHLVVKAAIAVNGDALALSYVVTAIGASAVFMGTVGSLHTIWRGRKSAEEIQHPF